MRNFSLIISALVTGLLIYMCNRSWGTIPPLGQFLSPQHGFWQNAEPDMAPASGNFHIPGLKDKVDVYFDERMVPHVFASNEEDAFFVQGYLHAKYRLWQMEFQTHAAAGRISEILGPGENNVYLQYDRQMRRLGMVYAAKKAVVEMEKEPASSRACHAYADGVNTYISQLSASQLPVEYKLLNYHPEKWTVLKTALFLKYMSLDLAGSENDFEFSNAKSVFDKAAFNALYPIEPDSLDPIVPKGTLFDTPAIHVKKPALADSLYFQWKAPVAIQEDKPDRDNGSNNWAVNGTKTKSGRPILCNDPHLGLNMPSLWYEMQIHTPEWNAYGVSFPGAPCIIIGFNDSCAFGFTNAMRDVRDYYSIRFKDDSKTEYWFDSSWQPTMQNIDTFHVKGRPDYYDTVAYTVFGPVMYDKTFTGLGQPRTNGQAYAVRWKAHDASNELMLFYSLNHARNYQDYYNALPWLTCPGQNCLFASKTGDIAIWQQAQFPAKWKRQGDFVMPGTDSSFMWQGLIPMNENPHLINPVRGFVSSANQLPVDTTYPYYIGGHHDLYRGKIINRYLSQMQNITVGDMEKMQTDNYNLLAETAMPLLMKSIIESRLSGVEQKYLGELKNWDFRYDPAERAPAIFNSWFDSLSVAVWADELAQVPEPRDWPDDFTLIEALLRDSSFSFIDNINTPEKETLPQLVTEAFKKAIPAIQEADRADRLRWSRFKDSGIQHLLKLDAFSRLHLETGGGENIINAIKKFHGPSWRMVVELTDETNAYGIYPGGQSGNPGSRYYDNFVDNWAQGKYYKLWVMKENEKDDKRVICKMSFTN